MSLPSRCSPAGTSANSPHRCSAGDLLDHYFCGEVNGKSRVWGHAVSRMGAIASEDGGARLGSGIILAPSLEYMDHARRRSRAARRTCGVAVLAGFLLQLAGRSRLASGKSARDRPDFRHGEYWPNFLASVIGNSALRPLDLEEKLGLAGGDIFPGALGLDQLWAAHPMLGYGDDRTPLKSLYLCGPDAHPGGGVTEIPGHDAAREILRNGVSPNS